MNRFHYQQSDFAQQCRGLAASATPDPDVEARAANIISEVRRRGDGALVEFTSRFDGWQPASANAFRVSDSEIKKAEKTVSPAFKKAVRLAHKNIASFAKRCLKKNFTIRNAQGGIVGEKYDALECVGVYVPGGTAPLASSVLMSATLARVVGCPRIIVCTPADREGKIHPAILWTARLTGATEIYKLGGAQAIAAMALGTATIPRVVKIFGPGNAYVVAAKRQLFGNVGIDLLPGPSELLVLADKTANPRFVAADMLAQAEHGSGMERVWLVTDSPQIADATETELTRQVSQQPRADYIHKALTNATIIVAKDLQQAADIANDLAPEHLELLIAKPNQLLPRLKTAGAIFIGDYTPTALGDYIAGPNHVLPTGGAGKFSSGLTVDQFIRKTSLVEYSPAALKKSIVALSALASAEGLEAHRRSAEIRFE